MQKVFLLYFLIIVTVGEANPDAKRLYDDLLSHYNRLIRPVSNYSQVVTVGLSLHLTQLIDLDLRNQILTTNVWVEHEWRDAKLTWDPDEYGGVGELMVPSEHIWLPDIVLYNNADGEYSVTTMTKAILYHDGHVKWNPPAIFKSYCEIDVRYFPFDMQTCFMKFGSWSYSGLQVDLKHIHSSENLVEIGMNLKDYYPSGEWDILHVPAERHARIYECCPDEIYPDIFFNITLRRKTLFYTVNLIIPCVGISCLSVLTFYLPADSGEKVALCITTLLSQTMFFLLMSEIIPSTSLALPLLGKYLLFTMCLVGLSVLVTIVILNVRYRKPSTHKMSPWVRKFFIQQLPKFLLMRVPPSSDNQDDNNTAGASGKPPSPAISASSSNIMMEAISRRLDQQRLQVLHPGHQLGSFSSRRWSRSNSPAHYGSQLLCEIINYNTRPMSLPSPPHTPPSPQITPTIPFPLPPPPAVTSISSRRSSSSSLVADSDHYQRPNWSSSAVQPSSAGVVVVPVDVHHASPGTVAIIRRSQQQQQQQSHHHYSNNMELRQRRPVAPRPPKRFPLELQKAIRDVQFIQNHMKREDEYDEEDNDWGYIAMVLDRFFLCVFTVASLVGTGIILFSAPALYDDSSPINQKFVSAAAAAAAASTASGFH